MNEKGFEPGTPDVKATLAQRGQVYGNYADVSQVAQHMKAIAHPWYSSLTNPQREAMDLIITKMARILTGSPNHIDNWHDIAGYADLVIQEITKGQVPPERAVGDLPRGEMGQKAMEAAARELIYGGIPK